jgi:hypothetical protein
MYGAWLGSIRVSHFLGVRGIFRESVAEFFGSQSRGFSGNKSRDFLGNQWRGFLGN